MAPLIAATLFGAYHSTIPLSLYLLAVALVSAIGCLVIVSNMAADDTQAERTSPVATSK